MNEPFDRRKYVQREVVNDLQRRVEGTGEQDASRLISLVGSAGIGKSWVLADLYRHALETDRIIALWLDLAPIVIHPLKHDALPHCHNENGRMAWLDRCVQEANEQFGNTVITLNNRSDFLVRFHQFLDAISSPNPGWQPVLFVDGFDDVVDGQELDYWQEQVLATFWGKNNKMRLLLARRDQQMLTHPLLIWNEEVIPLQGMKPSEQKQQIELRIEFSDDDVPDPAQIRVILQDHVTPSPLLNTCLFHLAAKHDPPIVTTDDAKICLDRFMDRAGLSKRPIDMVIRLARELPLEWAVRDLRKLALPIRLEDPDMIVLFHAGLVQQMTGTPYYRLDEGLVTLLKRLFNPAYL